jgi:DNA-binding transcriptional MerR regulator
MENAHPDLWTIDDLGAEVARALTVDYDGAASGRVRDVPDLRTIRYYTTLGLIDRPAEMRGRTALYGRRHLLQLVAIKKLQARGLSLAQVQQRMAGATDAALEGLAGGTIGSDDAKSAAAPGTRPVPGPGPERPAQARSFWKSRPVAIAGSTGESAGPGRPDRDGDERPAAALAYQDDETQPLQAIGLADRVLLLLAPAGPIDPRELPAIRQAAAPLIEHLRNRRLIQPRPKGEGHDRAASASATD